jgi:hypothetical protein
VLQEGAMMITEALSVGATMAGARTAKMMMMMMEMVLRWRYYSYTHTL